jgi:hypothetical protein
MARSHYGFENAMPIEDVLHSLLHSYLGRLGCKVLPGGHTWLLRPA